MGSRCRSNVPICEIMAHDRFIDGKPVKDKWQPLDNGKFQCPRCRNEMAVDTWLGTPYWKFCPMCGKPKEVNLL